MSFTLIGVTITIAALDWLAVGKGWKWLEYLAKPGVLLTLIGWLWSIKGFQGPLLWFTIGAIFSLFGDILLMLPKDRFIPGLISFLLAHLAYIVGFNHTLPPFHLASVVLLILVTYLGTQIYGKVLRGLDNRKVTGLQKPVLVYTLTIGVMVLSALLTLIRPDTEWLPWAALLVSAGAISFFISDTLLVWNTFIQPIPAGRLKVMTTYHIGQLGILIGALLNYFE